MKRTDASYSMQDSPEKKLRTVVLTAVLLLGAGCAPDTEIPTVAIWPPGDSDIVWNPMWVGVTAADNRGVTHLELEIDSVVVQAFSAAPYLFTYCGFASESASSHVILARAWDRAGNVGISAPVVVLATRGPRVIDPLLYSATGEPQPETVKVGNRVMFYFSGVDASGDTMLQGRAAFGNGRTTSWSALHNTMPYVLIWAYGHSWSAPGIYDVRAQVRNESGWESFWSRPLRVLVAEP